MRELVIGPIMEIIAAIETQQEADVFAQFLLFFTNKKNPSETYKQNIEKWIDNAGWLIGRGEGTHLTDGAILVKKSLEAMQERSGMEPGISSTDPATIVKEPDEPLD